MKTYDELINELYEKNSHSFIYNGSREHAGVLLNKLFSIAKKEVLLYSGGDDYMIYQSEDIASSISNIPEDVKIEIVLDNKKNIKTFREIFPKANFKIVTINKPFNFQFSPAMDDEEYKVFKHFIVIDGLAFRSELPHEPDDELVNAIGCFNRKQICVDLLWAFNKLKEISKVA